MFLVNYNGVMHPGNEALFDSTNRGVRMGEGLIETMLLQEGKIRFFPDHYERLISGITLLRYPFSISKENLLKEIDRTLAANDQPQEGSLRLQLFPSQGTVHFLMEYGPSPISHFGGKGLQIGIAKSVLKSADSISHLKAASRLAYRVARLEAEEYKWDDALLLNQYGRIAESTISNIFWIEGNEISTPPLTEGCIAGIFRKQLLNLENIAGFRIREQELTVNTLQEAAGIFLTNALRGIQPVTSFQGRLYSSKIMDSIADQLKPH